MSETNESPLEPRPVPSAQPATTGRRWPAVATTGLLMLIIGAAIGWFLQPVIEDDDDSTSDTASGEVIATTVAPAPTTTTAAPLPRLVHVSGAFSIADPGLGWQVQLDGASTVTKAPIIRYAQDVEAYRGDGTKPGFGIADLTGTPVTAEEYVTSGGSDACPVSAPEPFARGELTGVRSTQGPCPASADAGALPNQIVAIAGERPDGSRFGILINANPADLEETGLVALDSATHGS